MIWYDFVNFSLILCCIIVILRKYNFLHHEIRLLLYYFLMTLALELASEFFILKRKNNLFLYHFFIPLQYAILCLYFLRLNNKALNKKMMLAWGSSIFVMIVLSLFLNKLNQYFSFASILKNILISIFVLIYFRRIFISNPGFENNYDANVWICTGLFINCLGNFFIEGSMNYLMDADRQISIKLYYMHIALDFLFYIIFIFAIAANRNKTKNMNA